MEEKREKRPVSTKFRKVEVSHIEEGGEVRPKSATGKLQWKAATAAGSHIWAVGLDCRALGGRGGWERMDMCEHALLGSINLLLFSFLT